MNNVKVKKVPIELDKTRHIVFDLNAMCELEEMFGSTSEAFGALQSGSIKAIRSLLTAGLKHEDESLTEKQVGAMISFDAMKDVADLITEAISESMPDEKN